VGAEVIVGAKVVVAGVGIVPLKESWQRLQVIKTSSNVVNSPVVSSMEIQLLTSGGRFPTAPSSIRYPAGPLKVHRSPRPIG